MPWLIRAGKCLPVTATEAVVEFTAPPRLLFAADGQRRRRTRTTSASGSAPTTASSCTSRPRRRATSCVTAAGRPRGAPRGGVRPPGRGLPAAARGRHGGRPPPLRPGRRHRGAVAHRATPVLERPAAGAALRQGLVGPVGGRPPRRRRRRLARARWRLGSTRPSASYRRPPVLAAIPYTTFPDDRARAARRCARSGSWSASACCSARGSPAATSRRAPASPATRPTGWPPGWSIAGVIGARLTWVAVALGGDRLADRPHRRVGGRAAVLRRLPRRHHRRHPVLPALGPAHPVDRARRLRLRPRHRPRHRSHRLLRGRRALRRARPTSSSPPATTAASVREPTPRRRAAHRRARRSTTPRSTSSCYLLVLFVVLGAARCAATPRAGHRSSASSAPVYGVARFLLGLPAGQRRDASLGLTGAQWMCIGLVLAGVWICVKVRRSPSRPRRSAASPSRPRPRVDASGELRSRRRARGRPRARLRRRPCRRPRRGRARRRAAGWP